MKNKSIHRQHFVDQDHYNPKSRFQSFVFNLLSIVFYGKSTLQTNYYRRKMH